jgi:hypothetical protein
VGAADVNTGVEKRLLDGGTDAGTSGDVDDSVEPICLKEGASGGGVTDVGFDEAGAASKEGDVAAFEGGVVVVVEVIEDGEVVAAGEEAFGNVRSDEPGTASEEDIHEDRR